MTPKQDAEEQVVGEGDRASEQGRFAARAFVARWYRETGEAPSPLVTERMLFAYEIGYLRGRSDANLETMKLMNEHERKKSDAE